MNSRTCYAKMLWNTLAKRYWYGAVSMLILFVAMPLSAMLTLKNEEEAVFIVEEQNALIEFVCGANIGIVLLVIGLALLAAWSGLGWLHSRKQMDLYGSLPVKREVLYGMEVLASVLWFLTGYVTNFVLTLLAGIQKGIFTGKALRLGIRGIGVVLLTFLVIYFCAALAMMLTGRVFTGILGTLVLLGIIPLTILLLESLPNIFFVSYVSTTNIFGDIELYLSPVLLIAEAVSEIGEYLNGWGKIYVSWCPIVALVIWTIAEAVGSVCLLKLRPAESAEQSMVFSKTEGVIKACILYPISIGGGLFLWMLSGEDENLGWLWFGMIFVGVVISIVIEIIYHHDKKRIWEHKISTGISLGAAVLTILMFRFDVFGVDVWIPEEEEVENIAMIDNSIYNWITYPDGINSDTEEYLKNHMDETDGTCIYQYLPEALELTEKYRDAHFGNEEAREEIFDKEWHNITVVYRMKNGSVKERDYWVSEKSLYELKEKLYEQKIYKEAWFPLLITGGTYQFCYLYMHDDVGVSGTDLRDSEIISASENQEFVARYREELASLSYDKLFGPDVEWTSIEFEGEDGTCLSGNYPINRKYMSSMVDLEKLYAERVAE